MTEFLVKIRDVMHGWSEETRKFLAMVSMGIGLLVFFSLWISSVSSRLVAIGPAIPAGSAGETLPPTALVPSQDNADTTGLGNPVGIQPDASAPVPIAENPAPSPSVPPTPVPEQAPTPIQGVAETFGGLNQLFSRTTDQPSDTIMGKLSGIGAWLWGIVLNIFSWIQVFLLWFGGWLYHRASTLIAS